MSVLGCLHGVLECWSSLGPSKALNSDVSSALQSFLAGVFAGPSPAALSQPCKYREELWREHKEAATQGGCVLVSKHLLKVFQATVKLT